MCIAGYGPTQIARMLTEKGVQSPLTWRLKNGMKYHTEKFDTPENWTTTSITEILANPSYLGHTVNFRTTKKSYKSKKVIHIPKEDWVVFENTHEAIIDQDTFDAVQRLRACKRRPSRMGELNMFSGLLFCADCGAKLYLNRYKKQSMHSKDHFACATYKKNIVRPRKCSAHRIDLADIEQIVLADLQRVLAMAKDDERDFAELLQSNMSKVIRKDVSMKARECDEDERRIKELDRIIQRMYEDNINGKISDERFKKLSQTYEEEQSVLTERVEVLHKDLASVKEQEDNTDRFIRLVRKYTEITELTPEIVRTFIEKIIVHEKEVVNEQKRQTVEIIYNCVGAVPMHE